MKTTLIDTIKTANVQAMRDRDNVARTIYSIIINKHLVASINLRAKDKKAELTDDEYIMIIQKTIKELTEEADNYAKAHNAEQAEIISRQKLILEQYLPTLLSATEINAIIMELKDQSIPSVMKHFKEKYKGKVDMSAVNTVAQLNLKTKK